MTTTSERTLVNYTATDGVAVIELTNLPANTYSYEMMRQLDEAILQARFDENVHVLLIRGAGERFFCSGADIEMLNSVTPTFKYYFCLPEVNLGVLPGTGGTQRLARALPKNKAIELMTEGKLISFEQALELGLINYIFEAENYWDEVLNYAKQFCPPNKASKAVGRIKRAVQSGSEVSFSESLAIERELQQLLFQSEDAKEGIAAYTEKRKANFSGR